MTDNGKTRVAVIGGGCASMAAVWELSKQPNFDITVYQEGWRLGGKGASGRGSNGRIEEHGLHVWLGFYDNAFRMMRECYAELAKAATRSRNPATKADLAAFGNWRDAWIPENDVALFSLADDGEFERWDAHMPPRDGYPGDPLAPGDVFSLSYYMARAFELLRALILDTKVGDDGLLSRPKRKPKADNERSFEGRIAYIGWLCAFPTGAALAEALGLLATLVRSMPDLPWLRRLLPSVEAVFIGIRQWLEDNVIANDQRRFVWEIADLTLATMVGLIRSGVGFDERGLDAIDDEDCREWLAQNGASIRSLQSPFLRGLFDLSMGYAAGNPHQPSLSAGQGLRGTLRTFFGYRGAFMWRMRAGMGDVMFAPLYVALRRRGVKFEFFHRLTNVGVDDDSAEDEKGRKTGGLHVSSLTFDVQAHTVGNADYQPLLRAGENLRLCWPSEPLWDQLAGNAQLRDRNFESHWDGPADQAVKTLSVGAHFDFVLLGVGLGAIPYVCKDILARDQRWRDMTNSVKTVASQAFQLWLTEDLSSLGWQGPSSIVGAFAKPFDCWCDMAHVIPEENWAAPPKTCVYFCAVLPDQPRTPADDDENYPADRKREVRAEAEKFLQGPVKKLWPGAYNENGDFRWELLVAPDGVEGSARLDHQYFRANVNPSDRYVIHTPGSYRYRISPLDRTYDNLTIAGDWTDSGFHSGCVEGAVMSGLLAAHALSGAPKLENIIAYDHP